MNLRMRMILSVGSVLMLILWGAFVFIYDSQEKQAEELYRAQALAVDDCTDMVAKTIAKYGGVWIEQKDGIGVNPYLAKIPGLAVEMEGKNGKKYARVNGFAFIQEMTAAPKGFDTSKLNVGFAYRAPTDKALNPVNYPTPEEQEYLDKMRKEGLEEYSVFSTDEKGAPIYVHNRANRIADESCVKPCHLSYKVGAIESMKTVTLPIGKAEAMKQESLKNISYIFVAALLLVTAVLFMISRYVTAPIQKLMVATDRISKGEMDVTIDIERDDEIGELAAAFNRMIGEVNLTQNKLKRLYLDIVKAFVRSIEAKDRYTRGHSENVAKYALLLGEELKLSSEQMSELEIAALLHDIGKIGIREDVLNKPGSLTDEEYEHIKTHPDISANIVGSIPDLDHITDVIKHHHERYDGKGYCTGLKGERIPYLSRILAIADTFDAMTSDRPYRRGCHKEVAFTELRKCAGAQFDADLVEPFIKAMADIEVNGACDDTKAEG